MRVCPHVCKHDALRQVAQAQSSMLNTLVLASSRRVLSPLHVDHIPVYAYRIDGDILGDWPTQQFAGPDVEPGKM